MRAPVDTAEKRLEHLLELHKLLAAVTRDIGLALELDPVLQTVLRAMRSIVEFRGARVCLVDAEGFVRLAAADPPVGPDVTEARTRVGQGLIGRVVATGSPAYSPDIDEDAQVDRRTRSQGSDSGVRSYLAVPLVVLGRCIGAIQVDSAEADAFDAADLQVLEGLAAQVAGAIESARRHEQVVELERLKSDFIGRVSHELRTPLTIVSGFTDTLVTMGTDVRPEQREEILRRIQAATHRLQSLVDEMLTVAGYEAGMMAPHPAPTALAELLETVRQDSASPDRVLVHHPGDLTLFVDQKLLRHALRLLVDNALKYAGDAELVAAVDRDGGHPVVDVIDHGPGVPEDVRDHVFERFIRGSDAYPGMGLGLPLVRMLAGACGATVEMLHPPEGGACFRLRWDSLPAKVSPGAR